MTQNILLHTLSVSHELLGHTKENISVFYLFTFNSEYLFWFGMLEI